MLYLPWSLHNQFPKLPTLYRLDKPERTVLLFRGLHWTEFACYNSVRFQIAESSEISFLFCNLQRVDNFYSQTEGNAFER
jgi:hypothetical protein